MVKWLICWFDEIDVSLWQTLTLPFPLPLPLALPLPLPKESVEKFIKKRKNNIKVIRR